MANTYNFPKHRRGDTVEDVTFTIRVNGSPLNLTDVAVKMDIRRGEKKLIRYTSAVSGGLTILNPPTDGKLRFDKKIVSILPGKNKYDIEFTFPSGDVKTYIQGEWEITSDQTYD